MNPSNVLSTEATMIAQLKFRFGQKPVTAELRKNLQWACEDKSVESYLNDLDLFESQTQEDVLKNPKIHVYRVAYRLGAQVELCPTCV